MYNTILQFSTHQQMPMSHITNDSNYAVSRSFTFIW